MDSEEGKQLYISSATSLLEHSRTLCLPSCHRGRKTFSVLYAITTLCMQIKQARLNVSNADTHVNFEPAALTLFLAPRWPTNAFWTGQTTAQHGMNILIGF